MNTRAGYQAAFCASQEWILIFESQTGKLEDLTAGALDLLGYTRQEALQRNSETLFDSALLSELKQIRINTAKSLNVKCQKKSGEVCSLDSSLRGIQCGGQERVVVSLHDPTVNEPRIHETEKILNAAFDITPYAFVITTLDGTYLKINQSFSDSIGYTKEDLIGKPHAMTRLSVPEMKQSQEAIAAELLQAGVVRKRVTRVRHADGSLKTITFSSALVQYQGQKSILSITFDITELQYTEKLLRLERDLGVALSHTSSLDQALNQCLHTAMQAADMDSGGIYFVDEQNGDLRLTVHRGLSERFIQAVQHYPAHSPVAQVLTKGQALYIEKEAPSIFDELRKQEGFLGIAITPVFAGGKLIATLHLASRTKPILSANSRSALKSIASHIGAAISRIKAESETKQKAEELSTVINNVPGVVFITDPHPPWRIQFINNEVETLSGHSVEEFLEYKITPHQLILPEDRPTVKKIVEHAFRNHSSYTIEYRIRHANGSVHWVFEKTTPIFDSDGNPLALNGVNLDITDRKRAEEAAESANRIKSEFLDIAAHELRTPLTVLSILLQQRQKESVRERPIEPALLDRLMKQVLRLERLIDDLLNISRLERGVFTIQKERTDLRETISDAIEIFREKNPTRLFTLDAPFSPVFVDHDPDRIDQVVSNLLDNAVKYSPQSSPIEVRICPRKTTTRVSITDQGKGVQKEMQASLFTRFFRAPNNETARHQGLGIGLYICKKIMELHEGSIGFETEPEIGNTFYIELPSPSSY